MTLTIELTPSEEARLQAAAQNKGIEPTELARQLIANLPAPPTERPDNGQIRLERDPDLVARVKSIRGKYAHLGVTTEDLHRERQQDKAKEEERVDRAQP